MFHVFTPRYNSPVDLDLNSISLCGLNDYWFDPADQRETYLMMRDEFFGGELGSVFVSSNTRSRRRSVRNIV